MIFYGGKIKAKLTKNKNKKPKNTPTKYNRNVKNKTNTVKPKISKIEELENQYKAGKIDRFIISGARRSQWYDEPEAMRKALLNRGLPDNILILDGEGFHTIASIVRAKEVFSVDSLTIISQEFHNERAVFMASHNGVDAIAYNAANTSSRKWKCIMMGRECMSRVKAVFEVLYSKIHPRKYVLQHNYCKEKQAN